MSAARRGALSKIIEEQRQELFGACAVITVCAHAAIDQATDADELATALHVARKMIDSVASVLEDCPLDDAEDQE